MSKFLHKPLNTKSLPKGIPYIILNEAAERFSFYGMKGILVIYMTKYLFLETGEANLSEENAKAYFHLFTSAVYFFPIIGALISDIFLGKYKTIILLSLVYCLGHLTLAIDPSKFGLSVGLTLIAIGSGGIKPCVSAHLGDQFGKNNISFISKAFSWFYISINLGAFTSTLLIPYLLEHYSPGIAFGLPGIFMFLATFFFWLGRYKFIHIKPIGHKSFIELFNKKNIKNIFQLLIIFIFVSFFWCLFDQTGSSWILQAEKMDRNIFGIEILSSQIFSLNPIMILIFTPLFYKYLYPILNNHINLNYINKISIGFFLTFISFLIITIIQFWIDIGIKVNIGWQILAYAILTSGEIFVSITCLEISYTQAPKKFKSITVSVFLLSIAIGNIYTSLINFYNEKSDGSIILSGASYFLFFTILMLIVTIIFMFFSKKLFKERLYIQS
ncbi:MAG: Di-/tripeptide transporter [Alphaproteobacteria bacterium MarineAlpha6_Bin6]|nr:MFS transporter [Pelagibacteraceae bacterium]PPR31145.1 MAG: Di-/tripeptide transporter [Alphaproteobacteria bacterium MarineAlpha6_Bin6]PPR32705.1 MAG: Di-/tripeptide transporter [Alphaproteobacteria bacterium MarineAlpha6_Bin5]